MNNPNEKTMPPINTETFSKDIPVKSMAELSAYSTKEDLKSLAEKQKSDQNILLGIMAGVVIFVAVTFWIETSAVHRNYAQDKSILLQTSLQNNQLNKDYFDKVLFLNNEVQNLKIQLEVLRAKNSYLK